MSPAVKLALLAAVFVGMGAPFLKISQRIGVNAGEILVINGFASVTIGLLSFKLFNYQTNELNFLGILVPFITLLVMNIGFLFTNHSLSLSGGFASVVYAITPASTLLTILIGLVFLKEVQQVIVLRLLLGSLLILAGSFFVSTSLK